MLSSLLLVYLPSCFYFLHQQHKFSSPHFLFPQYFATHISSTFPWFLWALVNALFIHLRPPSPETQHIPRLINFLIIYNYLFTPVDYPITFVLICSPSRKTHAPYLPSLPPSVSCSPEYIDFYCRSVHHALVCSSSTLLPLTPRRDLLYYSRKRI